MYTIFTLIVLWVVFVSYNQIKDMDFIQKNEQKKDLDKVETKEEAKDLELEVEEVLEKNIKETQELLNVIDSEELYEWFDEIQDVFREFEELNKTFTPDMFSQNLRVWSQWEYVENLENFLSHKGFLNRKSSWIYDQELVEAMREFLIQTCNWPSDNMWILGPLARECIESSLE